MLFAGKGGAKVLEPAFVELEQNSFVLGNLTTFSFTHSVPFSRGLELFLEALFCPPLQKTIFHVNLYRIFTHAINMFLYIPVNDEQ